jgi:low affinity Fe/Cu permease
MTTTEISNTTNYVWNPAGMGFMSAIVGLLVMCGLGVLYWSAREPINKGLSEMVNGILRPQIDGKGIIRRFGKNWPLVVVLVAVIVLLGVFGR